MKMFNCDSCGQEMKLQKNFGVKPRGEKKKKYRIRRFRCDLCDIDKTIFADGAKDVDYYDNIENLAEIKSKTLKEKEFDLDFLLKTK